MIHGKNIKCAEGYTAFVPSSLPPPLEWNKTTLKGLSDADRNIGRLAQVGSQLPNPHLLIRTFVRQEAVLSSRIEGTQTSFSELMSNEAGASTEQDKQDLKEVENYIVALEYGMERVQSLPISSRLIRELHEKLMQGVRGDFATPGEFRKSQNWIGVAGCTLQNATYVPPPPNLVIECMGALETFFHESDLPPLLTVGLAHQQFEAIHPFLDGNGRVGRLLIILYLIEKEILPSPILYLSAFFEATRQEYYDRLLAVTKSGKWNEWLQYFLNGVARLSDDAMKRIHRLLNLNQQWKDQFPNQSDANAIQLIDQLLANPFVTAKSFSKKTGVAFTTAQRAIDKLVDEKILTQTTDAKRNKLYCAKEILAIVDEKFLLTKF